MKQKNATKRINNIIGQLTGVSRMIDDQKECVEVLTQLKAIKSAVGSLMNEIIEDQFDNCMPSLKSDDKKLLIKIKNYVKTN